MSANAGELLRASSPVRALGPETLILRLLQVVAETYEELIFSEPSKKFYERVWRQEPEKAPRPELSVLNVVPSYEEKEELDRINAARRQIATSMAKAQKQLDNLTGGGALPV